MPPVPRAHPTPQASICSVLYRGTRDGQPGPGSLSVLEESACVQGQLERGRGAHSAFLEEASSSHQVYRGLWAPGSPPGLAGGGEAVQGKEVVPDVSRHLAALAAAASASSL